MSPEAAEAERSGVYTQPKVSESDQAMEDEMVQLIENTELQGGVLVQTEQQDMREGNELLYKNDEIAVGESVDEEDDSGEQALEIMDIVLSFVFVCIAYGVYKMLS